MEGRLSDSDVLQGFRTIRMLNSDIPLGDLDVRIFLRDSRIPILGIPHGITDSRISDSGVPKTLRDSRQPKADIRMDETEDRICPISFQTTLMAFLQSFKEQAQGTAALNACQSLIYGTEITVRILTYVFLLSGSGRG